MPISGIRHRIRTSTIMTTPNRTRDTFATNATMITVTLPGRARRPVRGFRGGGVRTGNTPGRDSGMEWTRKAEQWHSTYPARSEPLPLPRRTKSSGIANDGSAAAKFRLPKGPPLPGDAGDPPEPAPKPEPSAPAMTVGPLGSSPCSATPRSTRGRGATPGARRRSQIPQVTPRPTRKRINTLITRGFHTKVLLSPGVSNPSLTWVRRAGDETAPIRSLHRGGPA